MRHLTPMILAAALTGLAAADQKGPSSGPQTQHVGPGDSARQLAPGDPNEQLLASAAALAENALVAVDCQYVDGAGGGSAEGVGVCYDAQKGDFLTPAMGNRVRAEDIKEVSLVLPGPKQERVPAQFLGARPGFGLAFLRAKEKRNWQAVRFAASSDLKTGQLVVSAGLMPGSSANVPYVGMGYVSARLKVPDTLYYVTGGKLTCLGSPVFSSSGLAVGLVSRTVYMDYQTPTPRGPTMVSLKGMQEASFFIPVEEFVDALKQVPHDGTVARPAWMGVLKALGASKEQADLMKLAKPAVMIDQVIPASPAAQAGLKSGDVLVALDGRSIELLSTPELTGENFLRKIRLTPVGKKVTVTVSRQGAEKQVELTLTEMPILAEEAPRYVNDSLGLAVREKVDLDLYLDQSGAKQVSGLSVIGVADQGPAQAAGLKTGDVITAVNGTNVRSADLFRKQVEQSVKDDPQKGIVFMVHRGDAEPRPVTVAPAVRDAAREDRPQP